MKEGTLIIEQRDGKWGVWVKRADGEEIPLDGFSNPEAFKEKNGHSCWYLKKKSQLIVRLDNRDIYNNADFSNQKPRVSSKKTPSDFRKREIEDFAFDIPEPELTAIPNCPERKKIAGENLFDLNSNALRLPYDTARKLQDLRSNRKIAIDNFNLLLNKTVHFLKIGEKGSPEYNHISNGKANAFLFRSSFDDKSDKQNKITRKFEVEFSFASQSVKAALKSLVQRQNHLLKAQEESGLEVEKKRLAIDNRLIAGLGGASVFETSMTLHHIYGIPYLPGSSIKGLVRSWIIINCFLPGQQSKEEGKRGKEAEKAAMKNVLFAYIFGTDTEGPEKKAHRGKVIFFDAYPQSPPVIETDVMNVHYPKYYGGQGKPPADHDSPNPIHFLTISKCDANRQPLEFSFALATRENPGITDGTLKNGMEALCKKDGDWRKGLSAESTILDVAHYWLHSALTSHGIGAKTAVGYGYFHQHPPE
ncbi:MAG: type III-B CRISPR module RAMP protein Cmr6 [Lewinellaceae bacterium]|nr:type III-B CRISPR module RAMP protein Cmr6 [Lewinellaceae bacterium]